MFLSAAQTGRNRFFYYLITVSTVVLAQILGQLPLVWYISTNNNLRTDPFDWSGGNLAAMEQNLLLIFLLIPFAFGLAVLWIGLHYLHQRPFKSLITPFHRVGWTRITNGLVVWFVLLLLVEIAFYFTSPDLYALEFRAGPFFVLLAISLFLLPLQTSFEELFFRGYLLQGFGNLFKSPWIAWSITSITFGAMHIWNPEVTQFGLTKMMVYYISFGMFLGAVTLLDDGLELALGVHAANNIYGAVIVGFSGSALQTPSLFYLNELDVDFMLIGYLIAVIIFFLLFFWKSKPEVWRKLFVWRPGKNLV